MNSHRTNEQRLAQERKRLKRKHVKETRRKRWLNHKAKGVRARNRLLKFITKQFGINRKRVRKNRR